MPGSHPILRVQGLTWLYPGGSSPLLSDLELCLERPGLYALVGPSGSGKSTLLSLLAGFLSAGPQRIFWDGEDFGALNEPARREFRRRRMGLVFQDSALIPELDVAANVGLRGLLAGRSQAEIRQESVGALARLGMESLAGRDCHTLSRGEAMRVALLRAVFGSPDYLLADEPTGGLDRENARMVMEWIAGQVEQDGLTALVATHDSELVERCDRVFRLRDGRLFS